MKLGISVTNLCNANYGKVLLGDSKKCPLVIREPFSLTEIFFLTHPVSNWIFINKIISLFLVSNRQQIKLLYFSYFPSFHIAWYHSRWPPDTAWPLYSCLIQNWSGLIIRSLLIKHQGSHDIINNNNNFFWNWNKF